VVRRRRQQLSKPGLANFEGLHRVALRVKAAPDRAPAQAVVVAAPQLVEDAHLAIHDMRPDFELRQALRHLGERAGAVDATLGRELTGPWFTPAIMR
jgi:hypothetical protein